MKTGIIILNYNTAGDTRTCIESIRRYVESPYTIYLVDGNPGGEDRQQLIADYDAIYSKMDHEVRLILLDENLGYSGGNNVGAFAAIQDGCDALFVINSDIILENDAVTILASDLQDYALAVPHINRPDGSNGQTLMKNLTFWLSFVSKLRLSRYLLRLPSNRIAYKVADWESPLAYSGTAMGCSLMIRSDVFREIGGFDDAVFLYFEENILGIKLGERGLTTYYNPAARVIHNESTATGRLNSAAKYLYFYSSEYYTLVNYCKIGALQRRMMRNLILQAYDKRAAAAPDYAEQRVRLIENMDKVTARQLV